MLERKQELKKQHSKRITFSFSLQGTGTGEASSYPDSLEWVSILFSWHVAGNFLLFTGSLLLSRQLAHSDLFSYDSCLSLPMTLRPTGKTAGLVNSGSNTPRSTSFQQHSPATVQTNASPCFQQGQGTPPIDTVTGMINSPSQSNRGTVGGTFSYIQTKQLPALPATSNSES